MGKYLDIAKAFEAERQAEEQPQPPTPPADYRDLYHRTAATIREECFSLDACWLLDHHPELWERLTSLDDELSMMECTGVEEQTYRATLGRLVACVQHAGVLYERERSVQGVQ